MEENKPSKAKIIIGFVFVFLFLVSIGCFIGLAMLTNAKMAMEGAYCGIAGFILFAISVFGFLNPHFQIGKVFFKDFLFKKKNKKELDN